MLDLEKSGKAGVESKGKSSWECLDLNLGEAMNLPKKASKCIPWL